ncbi:MAG: choice-of-anchor B family protein, partial [Gemmatimonadota bacterium]
DEWRVASELTPASGDRSGGYGSSVLLTPDRAYVGAPRQDDGGGAVYVYEAGDDGWTETARIDGRIVGEARRLGSALGIDDDVLLVGAPGTGDDAGQVIFLRRDEDGGWQEVERARAPASEEAQARNRFGASVDASHPAAGIVVGAPGTSAVYRLHSPATTDLPATDVTGVLGAGVAAGEDIVAAGAPSADGGVGRVVVYEREAPDEWTVSVIEPSGALETIVGGEVRCAEGDAAGFPCRDVDLLSFLTVESLGGEPGERVSDIWGWTDPETGVEYALVGRSGGLVVVDLSRPDMPTVVATVAANSSGARDIKTYANHAFFTGDGAGEHGLVVVDLTRLRELEAADVPVELEPDAVYDGVASAHNLAIDPGSGFAYVVRPSQGGETCGGGLHMVDVRTPDEPTFAGCFTDSAGVLGPGSSHDAQCVVYDGPDPDYTGRQICFASNESLLRIVDVTDKENPVPISSASYPAQAYVHQGWLTDDHAWFYLDDELDELVGTTERTRTLVWDLQDLDDPTFAGELLGPDGATDHNLFIKGDRMYQANYQAGLRVVDISDPVEPVEVGHFDTTPYGGNPPGFEGAWTAYPFFDSGVVVVSSMNEGLFVLRPVRPLIP